MDSEDKRYKLSHKGAGSNPTAAKGPLTSLLENALNNPLRRRHGFNVLFADIKKAPKREWIKWQSQPQTDDDIRALFSTWKPDEATCWGFVTGYKSLEALDFDWAWVYRLWKTKFGERADTLTVQTPNGGLRPHYLCEKPETHDKFKESLHVELKGPGHFVVYEGKANREDGFTGEYKIVIDNPIREDNTIIADTLAFLQETYGRYSFLWWNCLRPHFRKKALGKPSHDLRLFLSDIMVCEGFGDDEIHNLFRDFADYQIKKTQEQVDYTRQRVKAGLKPPTCETLRQKLGWSEENCEGCSRKGVVKREKRFFLGDYRLELEGPKAIVYDQKGSAVWSGNAASLSGYQIKKDLAKKLNLQEAVVDKAAAELDHYLQQKTTLEGECKTPPNGNQEEFPPDVEKEAEELLKDPGLLHRINKALDARLYGEHENRLFMVMAGCGARQKTSIIRLEGPNAVGKKMLYCWLPEFFGEANVVVITSSTFPYWKRKALEGWDSKGKIIVCVEERGDYAGTIKYTFEQVYSEDKIIFGMNVKNEEGEWTPVEVVLQGPLLYVTSSTESEPSLHSASREWSVKPSPDMEQTRAVDKWWRQAELKPKSQGERENREIQVIRCALSKLKPYKVKIPFIDKINFPLEYLTDRRKARDFDNLIRYSAFIHQRQRPIINETIYALPHDFHYATRIASKILAVSRGALSPDEEDLLNFIKSHPDLNVWTKEGRTLDDKHPAECFKVSTIAERKEYRHVHERTLRDTLNSLAKKRRIGKNVISRSNVVYYNLSEEGAESSPSTSMSPVSPEELISGITRVEELQPKDREAVVVQVDEFMNLPIADPLTATTQPSGSLYSSTPSEPESTPFDEKKPDRVEGAQNSTSTGSVNVTPKPGDMRGIRNTEKPALEDVPKSVRVPPSLDEFMQPVCEGNEWMLQCVKCRNQSKKMFTSTIHDMIMHCRAWHGLVSSLTHSSEGDQP